MDCSLTINGGAAALATRGERPLQHSLGQLGGLCVAFCPYWLLGQGQHGDGTPVLEREHCYSFQPTVPLPSCCCVTAAADTY